MTPFETELRHELRKIAESLVITSPTSFIFADLPEVKVDVNSSIQNSQTSGDSQSDTERHALVAAVADMLYWNCYVQRFGEQPARPLEPLAIPMDMDFQAELSKANQTESRWEPDWEVVQTGLNGEVQVRKGDRHRAPVPGEFLSEARPGVRPQIGDLVSIRVTRESTLLQWGFYYCFSEQIPDQFEEFNSVRFYFNVRHEGASLLLKSLSGRLNRFQIPFRFKCPAAPSLFNRRDSGVLYVPWRFLQIASRCVADVLSEIETFLDDDVPLFTKRVHRGISMAEDPGELRSFGQYRCELVAQGLVDAWRSSQSSRTGVSGEDAVGRSFHEAGVSFDRPWLNPGSKDWLELPDVSGVERRRTASLNNDAAAVAVPEGDSSEPAHRRDEFLKTADQIGSRICRDAVWSGNLCNWLEWDSEPIRGTWLPVYRALGPSPVFPLNGVSLYSGTVGISLFLARLYRFTQDPLHRDTTLASARQVLQQVSNLSKQTIDDCLPTAFYTGWFGAVWGLTEIGREANDGALIESALDVLDTAAASEPRLPNTDVINGSAGLITGLLDLAWRFNKPGLAELARQHGEFLIESAQQSDLGWSWETLNVPVHHHLTGYGHGVSGIVCALAELYRVTGDARFETAVQEGLRYESNFFSSEEENWHDHRQDVAAEDESAFQFGWCHGAPGVGMARFRLLELGFDSDLIRRDLEAATRSTMPKLSYQNAKWQNAFCLCHGLAGNSELPLLLSEPNAPDVGITQDDLLQSVDDVARSGVDLFEQSRNPWPCNPASTGETPVLFNGMSGIGYFYLRAYAPDEVSSIMLLRPNVKT